MGGENGAGYYFDSKRVSLRPLIGLKFFVSGLETENSGTWILQKKSKFSFGSYKNQFSNSQNDCFDILGLARPNLALPKKFCDTIKEKMWQSVQ